MNNPLPIPGGHRRIILKRRFSSVPLDYHFSIKPAHPGESVSGVVEVKGSRWFFPKTVKIIPLREDLMVSAGYWDTFFTVAVIPDHDVVVTQERQGGSRFLRVVAIAVIVALLATLIVWVYF